MGFVVPGFEFHQFFEGGRIPLLYIRAYSSFDVGHYDDVVDGVETPVRSLTS